jgi:hypothetical protein
MKFSAQIVGNTGAEENLSYTSKADGYFLRPLSGGLLDPTADKFRGCGLNVMGIGTGDSDDLSFTERKET